MSRKDFYTNFYAYGSDILLRGVTSEGKRFNERVTNYHPTLYLPASSSETSTASSIFKQPLSPIRFDTIRDAKEVIAQYDGVAGTAIYGYDKFANAWAAEQWKPDEMSHLWDFSKISIANIDIETECERGFPDPTRADEIVYLITMHESLSARKYVFGIGHFILENEIDVAICCENENELLEKFLILFDQLSPDVLVHWNGEEFDVRYLVNRIEKVLGEGQSKRLSPWRKIKSRTVRSVRGDIVCFDIVGVASLDLMKLYQKFVLAPRESYKLDHIGEVDCKFGKLRHSSGTPGHLLYKIDFQAAVNYNVRDVDVLMAIDAKRNIIRTVMTIAYGALINYSDVFSPIKTWDNIIYCDLLEHGMRYRLNERIKPKSAFEGAYVKPPIVGRHEWIVSCDVTSMYPSIIRALNISPETIANGHVALSGVDLHLKIDEQEDKKFNTNEIAHNFAFGVNGACYQKHELGIMPRLVRKMFEERKAYKKKMLAAKRAAALEKDPVKKEALKNEAVKWDLLQNSKKVLLNSLYGAMGNPFFRFYDLRHAEAITLTGQLMIRWVAKDLNEYVNKISGTKGVDYVIAVDTDSCVLNFGPFVKRAMVSTIDKEKIVNSLSQFVDERIQPIIDASFSRLAQHLNAFEPEAFSMKREAIADAGVFMAKKRYILNVLDNEGVRTIDGDLKIMGLEAIRSSTPSMCREWLKKIYPIFLLGNEKTLQDKVAELKAFHASLKPEEIAFNRGVSDVKKWDDGNGKTAKGTPINSRAAIVYNHALEKAGLTKRYPKIVDGDKIKFIMLKEPNKFGSNVIGWADDFPEELGVRECVDREMMFSKTFQDAVKPIAKVVGWDVEKKNRLDWIF